MLQRKVDGDEVQTPQRDHGQGEQNMANRHPCIIAGETQQVQWIVAAYPLRGSGALHPGT
ncbi:hypothetical protein GCM10011359_26950 [Nesterenkonia alkaliphila]|nr:hypothetical protein GCM10011359_26950 [Nesterenkonia alkaliphila]